MFGELALSFSYKYTGWMQKQFSLTDSFNVNRLADNEHHDFKDIRSIGNLICRR